MALARITKAIFDDENSILTISAKTNGEYGIRDVFIGLSCFVNRRGNRETLVLNLSEEERRKLCESAELLDKLYKELDL